MKVILTQDIRGKGKRGQMIEVSDGYARNFLFPKKLAQEANADNVNTMKMNDKARQEREAKERAEAMDISKRMKTFTVTVNAKGGGAGRLFGSVTNTEIAEALAAQQKIVLIVWTICWAVRCRSHWRRSSLCSAPCSLTSAVCRTSSAFFGRRTSI